MTFIQLFIAFVIFCGGEQVCGSFRSLFGIFGCQYIDAIIYNERFVNS